MVADDATALSAWWCASRAPGSVDHPKELEEQALDWLPYEVPGTIGGAHRAAGVPLDPEALDGADWWLRTTFLGPDEPVSLHLGGVATVADVWLNGTLVLQTANMFRRHVVDVDPIAGEPNELVVRCRALAPILAERRPRPRWRTGLASHQGQRWLRTSLLGRTPTASTMAPVGLWRSVALRPRPAIELHDRRLTVDLDGGDGIVRLRGRLSGAGVRGAVLVVDDQRTTARLDGPDGLRLTVEARLPQVRRWWPATHGDQPRSTVRLDVETDAGVTSIPMPAVGFRSVVLEGLDDPRLVVNGVPIFARGAVWVSPDPIGLAPSREELRTALVQARDAGMNLLRVAGDTTYERDDFHELCDELGILVWQDLMLARMDYPADDPVFVAELVDEVDEVLDALEGHPSTAVVCGGSEVHQQAVMAGTTLGEAAGALYDEVLAGMVAARLPSVSYRAHSPMGGHVPFAVDTGISHYFGVGAYLRDLVDARVAGPRFVTECLAFANVPGDETVEALLDAGVTVHGPEWKRRVPRDPGVAWDFEDVRDHYVRDRFGVDPLAVRMADPDHYLDLGRLATAEVIARTVAEWRRPASPCNRALLLSLRDLEPGCGWGLVDAHGRAKAAYFALKRVLQPRAVLVVDEGLNGLDAWLVNDHPEPSEGELVVSGFRGATRTAHASTPVAVGPHASLRCRLDDVLGGFHDLTHAYRFGPRAVDTVAVEWVVGGHLVSRAVHSLADGPLERRDIGLAATGRPLGEDRYEIEVSTVEAARGVLISAPGCTLDDDAFDLEPGGRVVVAARCPAPPRGRVRAVNALFSAGIHIDAGADAPASSGPALP